MYDDGGFSQQGLVDVEMGVGVNDDVGHIDDSKEHVAFTCDERACRVTHAEQSSIGCQRR